jgi:hypothetical protein
MPSKKKPSRTSPILDTRPKGTDEYGERALDHYAHVNGLRGWKTKHVSKRDAAYNDVSYFEGTYFGITERLGKDLVESRLAINVHVRTEGRQPKPRLEDVVRPLAFTRCGSYTVDIGWDYLENWIANQQDPRNGASILNLNPDFQREHVWTHQQQIAYVEYVLRGGHAAKELYFNCIGWNRGKRGAFEIVDGKQRLEAVRSYLRNEVPVFGRTFMEYSDNIGFRMEQSFKVYVNDLATRAEVLQWYLDLNTGGTPHTEGEINRVQSLLEIEKRGPECGYCSTPLEPTEALPGTRDGRKFCSDRCKRLGA